MARQPLVLDASVGVKWFSGKGEADLSQALAIREAHLSRKALIIVPDLFYYEVANAIVHKASIPSSAAESAAAALFALGLQAKTVDSEVIINSIKLSRRLNITVYDSCYMVVAQGLGCPLVTANPRHQGQASGCLVISLKQWQ
jgi:predicted nucleic acid-binding protein